MNTLVHKNFATEDRTKFLEFRSNRSDFRVDLEDLPVLAQALNIPERFVCPNRTLKTGMEGLCVALRRFAYPCRYSDMIPRFGRSVSELSLIAAEVTDHIFNTHGYLLADLNQPWLHPDRLQEYANAIHDACTWRFGKLPGIC